MKPSERRAKEKEELKEKILNASKELFLEKGIEQTTIRKIAQSISYSVGTVYTYYKDKNAILNDLHKMGFLELAARMRILSNVSDPMERLEALGRVYIGFAIENPQMYDLMFLMEAPIDTLEERNEQTNSEREWREGKGTFEALRDTVADCISAGHFKNHEVESLSFGIWGFVHGICALQIRDRVNHIKFEEPDIILEKAFNSFNKLLRNS